MAKMLDIEIFKVIDAGNFWAHPTGLHGSEIQDVLGRLNDFCRNNSAPQLQPKKGQMCVVQRTSDNCWYRARIQNVLQTLSGPQASVFLVDLAEATLVPCCRIREVPAAFQTIPVQAMECFLAGIKPLGLVTSYFDLTTSKQITDRWDEAATNFFKTLVQGSKLQVTIQEQDDRGRHHVLLLADSSGHAQVCVNDELVQKDFAVYSSEMVNTSARSVPELSPNKAAKLQALNDKFQKQGSEMINHIKEYVSSGKRTGNSEESPSTDDELGDYNRTMHKHLSFETSPLNILRRQLPGYNSYGAEQGLLHGPAARIPSGNAQSAIVRRFAPQTPVTEEASSSELGKEPLYKRPSTLSSDEACSSRVRFVSARLPATGTGGVSMRVSKTPDCKTLKPILKRTSPLGSRQSSGSSSEQDDRLRKSCVKLPENEAPGGTAPRLPGYDSYSERYSLGNTQQSPSRDSISTDSLFGDLRQDSPRLRSSGYASSESTGRKAVPDEALARESSQSNSAQDLVSLIVSLRDACQKRDELAPSASTQRAVYNESLSSELNGPSVTVSEKEREQSLTTSLHREPHRTEDKEFLVKNQSSPNSSIKSPLLSTALSSNTSVLRSSGGTNLSFSDGVLIQSEGAPAPRPTTSIESFPFAEFLRRLGVSAPSPIQAHIWPALRRGRDVVGVSSSNSGRMLAYLLPIINQIVEERQVYAELPSGNGPFLVIMVSSSRTGVEVYQQCMEILARQRNIRVQIIYGGGAEESQILPLVNGCEILIATPPCLLRILKKSYTTLNRLCHTVFHDADIMVEDFTSEIREIMRLFAKLLKSQPFRSAPRQVAVMASSWTVGVASLVKAYLGNPVLIMTSMIEAAIFRGVRQIATLCSASQTDVHLLGYLESFISTKDICIFTSTATEADKVGELLKANAYYTLVAHEFLEPHELASVNREWNTPHATNAMPVLVMTDGVIGQMNIRNASCVIHYIFPGSKAKFGQRLTALAGTFCDSKDHGCISIIFVAETRYRESPFILQLVKRSGQEVPVLLEEMVKIATKEKEKKMKDLCHSLKAFGTCRFKRGTRNCSWRHSVVAELDKPLEGVPTFGIVKVLILRVMDASCYWVRLLEHRSSDTCQSSEVAGSTKFLELTMAVSGWYSDPNHRVRHELISVGTLCAVQDDSSFHRVKVCYVSEKDSHSNRPMKVEIHYVDRGDFRIVHVDKLLQLPPDFHSCPFQAIQVFLSRVQPLDKDLDWTEQADYFVKHVIEGKEMEGRVGLSLGNTMWLDPLVERKHLQSINVTTNVSNVRMELLKEQFATDNKQHIKLLKSLCENVIDLPMFEPERSGTGDNSSEGSSALETVVLTEDRFQDVYVSAVENPGLFFVQLSSSQESLEYLREKIDAEVGKVDAEGSDIMIGSLCVARFTQDDKWYRARVLGSRPENEYDVFYVDFGDREWITEDRILPAWSNILESPLQAIECSLVHVVPLENDWSEEDSDAFWEIVSDKQLVAKVKSKCASLVAGCHRFVIELYDTTTQHDVIISHEIVAAGHAQTSPEGIQILFPQSLQADGQHDYDLPFQRIPDMCLQAHQCRDPVKKIEILKELQSVVLNSESEKDEIRECGGVQGLCRLLNFNRDPLVQQHILASLASLTFENEDNCEEVRKFGGLRTMCSLLKKTQNSAVQESLAWALKNMAITERNQDETREQGGLDGLCNILQTASDEKVQESVAWTIGSIVKDHDRNCEAVEMCGGLKTLCELVARLQSEDAIERATWALAALGIVPRNRNFIRQYGGIENVCKKLQGYPSEQFVKQGALTLKVMASNNQSNRDVMNNLGMIGTLRRLMTDDTHKLGIIARRVCWDLLQRLLGQAGGAAHHVTPPTSPANPGLQRCEVSSGSANNQNHEAKEMNGSVVDSDDSLPPLEGEDSDTETTSTTVSNAAHESLNFNVSSQQASRANGWVEPPSRSHVASNRVSSSSVSANACAVPPSRSQVTSNHVGSSPVNEANVLEPFSVRPRTVWSQTRDLVRVCVKLRGVGRQQTDIMNSRLRFRTQMGRTLYELDLELFDSIDAERSVVKVKGAEVQISLRKRNHAAWTRLLRTREKLPYVSIDFDRWEVWSSSEEDEGNGNGNNRNANARPRPANPNPNTSRASPRSSEDRGESKQVLLPEMLPSDSDSSKSDDDSLGSDVDCLKFH